MILSLFCWKLFNINRVQIPEEKKLHVIQPHVVKIYLRNQDIIFDFVQEQLVDILNYQMASCTTLTT